MIKAAQLANCHENFIENLPDGLVPLKIGENDKMPNLYSGIGD